MVLTAGLLELFALFHVPGNLDFSASAAAAALALIASMIVALWPALQDGAANETMAPLIALVGCDGSGKSTLSADLLAQIAKSRDVQSCYLGLGSSAIGARIKGLPLIGPAVERRLAKKATQTRTRGEKIPGIATALVVYLLSLARLRRFRRMVKLRRAGVAVITDRYPQSEVAGFYDGPGLSAARAENWLIAALAREERHIYRWMASFQPDVVIRLNIDADTAYARKPDHNYELIARKVSVTPQLQFNGAHIVDLDSRQPYQTVRDAALRVAREALEGPSRRDATSR